MTHPVFKNVSSTEMKLGHKFSISISFINQELSSIVESFTTVLAAENTNIKTGKNIRTWPILYFVFKAKWFIIHFFSTPQAFLSDIKLQNLLKWNETNSVNKIFNTSLPVKLQILAWLCSVCKFSLDTSAIFESNIGHLRKVYSWIVKHNLTLWEPAYDIFITRFRLKNYSTDCARELFNGSNGSASPLVCTRKKIWLGGADFLWVTS